MYTSHHRVFRSSFDLSRLPSPLPLSSPTILPRRLKSRCARATGRHALRAASVHARHPTCRASRCAQHRTEAKRRGVTSSRRWADRQSLSQISPNLARCLVFSPPHTPPPACKHSATSHLSTLDHPLPRCHAFGPSSTTTTTTTTTTIAIVLHPSPPRLITPVDWSAPHESSL